MNHSRFFHFGCWNQNYCDKSTNTTPISNVMKLLDKKVHSLHPNFIVVAGDNYYPDKIKTENAFKKHIVKQDKFDSGFKCLPKNVEIDMILGNHDLETNSTNNTKLFIEDEMHPEPPGSCFIMNHEIELASSLQIQFVLQKCRWLNKDTVVIMIDTTMYDIDDDNNNISCYRQLLKNPDLTIEDLHALALHFVMSELMKGEPKNIIFIGHHPITGYKKKEKKGVVKVKLIDSYAGLLHLLYSVFTVYPTCNYYYLCADLHLFQVGTVGIEANGSSLMSIKQYIVGTGGTKLDDDPFLDEVVKRDEIHIENYMVHYNMTEEDLKLSVGQKHGFLECECGSSLQFVFHSVLQHEGGKKKNTKKSKKVHRKTKKRIYLH